MYFKGKLCVPEARMGQIVKAQHIAAGHVEQKRLWNELLRRFEFHNYPKARHLAQNCQKWWQIFQATEPPHISQQVAQEPNPVPPYLMDSVAIDVFNMPEAQWEGSTLDCFVLCVDRLSGWMIALPEKRLGLDAKKVAKQMYSRHWSPFGLPSVITSDQGPQFVGAWWRTLCSCFGIRQAFAQAYHHQANGRAEVAGHQVQTRLRKIQLEDGILWPEALPIALRQIHDMPGEGGYSPYEIMFGRKRPSG